MYTGRGVDHSKVIFCESVNIEARHKVKSSEKYLYIKLSTKWNRNSYFMKNYECYFFIRSFIHSFICPSYSSWRLTVTDDFSGKSHYTRTVNHILATKTNRANSGRFTRRYCYNCSLNACSSERADSLRRPQYICRYVHLCYTDINETVRFSLFILFI